MFPSAQKSLTTQSFRIALRLARLRNPAEVGLSMASRLVQFVAAMLTAAALLVPAASGQTSLGSISGLVTDQSGAAVPDVTNVGRNATFKTVSNEQGFYVIAQLLPGTYSFSAASAGVPPLRARRHLGLDPAKGLRGRHPQTRRRHGIGLGDGERSGTGNRHVHTERRDREQEDSRSALERAQRFRARPADRRRLRQHPHLLDGRNRRGVPRARPVHCERWTRVL